MSCGGNCLLAGAGLLTWWRRAAPRGLPPGRARRAARPEVGAVPADPGRALARFPRQLTLALGGFAFPTSELARAGRPGAPKACP